MVSGKDVELARERLLGEGWDDSADIVSDMEKIIKAQVRKEKHDAKRIGELEKALIAATSEMLYANCQGDCGRVLCSARSHEKEAREQLHSEGLL